MSGAAKEVAVLTRDFKGVAVLIDSGQSWMKRILEQLANQTFGQLVAIRGCCKIWTTNVGIN